MVPDLVVPDVVRTKARIAGVPEWADHAPSLAGELARRWDLTLHDVLDGGTESLVVTCDRADGTPAVLKLLVPRDDAGEREAAVLRRAAGDGCVRLYEHDPTLDALLLERAGPSLSDLDIALVHRHEIMADTARALWRPVPDAGFVTGRWKAGWLAGFVVEAWERTGRPVARAVIDHAIDVAGRRADAHDDATAVLCHGDVHQWNTLRRLDDLEAWVFVDPDGLCAEAEYDLGVILREDPVELLDGDPVARAVRLADRVGCDPVAAWEWGVIERVSTGLLCTELGVPDGPRMLATATALLGVGP